jgi:hypothetical protein
MDVKENHREIKGFSQHEMRFFPEKKHEKSRLKPKLSGESTWIDDVTLQNWWIKEQLKKSSCIDHGSQDPVCLDGT